MKDTEYIIGVFNYINAFPELHSESAYYLIYLLDEKGLLDRTAAIKLYNDRFRANITNGDESLNTSKMIGPFESTDQLNQFAFQLCEEFNAAKVSLLSVQDYNSLMESTQAASDFHRGLQEIGNVMENIERKKKGFLSRFF